MTKKQESKAVSQARKTYEALLARHDAREKELEELRAQSFELVKSAARASGKAYQEIQGKYNDLQDKIGLLAAVVNELAVLVDKAYLEIFELEYKEKAEAFFDYRDNVHTPAKQAFEEAERAARGVRGSVEAVEKARIEKEKALSDLRVRAARLRQLARSRDLAKDALAEVRTELEL